MKNLRAAIGFLTRIPMREAEPQRGMLAWFWLPGLMAGIVWYLAFQALGPTGLGAAAALAGEAVLTGGLHWDGLVDTFDGWMAPPAKRVQARRDARIGTGGALFLGLVLLAFWTLWSNAGGLSPVMLILPPVWARASLAWGVSWRGLDPSSRSLNGIVQVTEGGLWAWIPLMAALLFGILAMGFEGVNVFGGTLLVVGVFLLWGRRLYGGMNGDVIGASAIVTELVSLYFIIAVTRSVF